MGEVASPIQKLLELQKIAPVVAAVARGAGKAALGATLAGGSGNQQDSETDAATDFHNRMSKNKLKKEVDNPFAVATAQAKKMGYSNFTEGSEGNKKREEIAEAIKRKE